MGLSDDGDDLATLAQVGSSRARVHGSDQDIVALVVPSGAGTQTQFDLISLCAADLASPVSSIESPVGSRAKQGMSAPGG